MWLLLLEAGFAGFLFIFIVWWTMYSGPEKKPPTEEKEDQPE
ncbi:hypothetical protein RCH09_003349 [Actimicrobium sp. GrIS 1.19]|nr:hypothetical protein [Actimicrobium sp. GrIS 1.19]